jgi:protein tyrosine phosphatase (PTP) superfamily phosphohydrolase (DUF442 family)
MFLRTLRSLSRPATTPLRRGPIPPAPAGAVVLVFLLLTAFSAGCGSTTVGKQLPGVGNFGKVERRDDATSFFYRGNQPTKQGIATLRRMGVKAVVNLRNDFDPREEGWVRNAGMQYLLIKTSCRDIQPLQIATFMGKMREYQNDQEKWPVFVHCRFGKDRTGLYVAVWRIAEEGWGREAAIDELTGYGHQPKLPFGCTHIVPYLRRFDPAPFRVRSQARVPRSATHAATTVATPTAPPPAAPEGASS